MSKFDDQDFSQNPGKYRLFKTARVAGHIVTHNGEHDLPAGQFVAVSYRHTARHPFRRRNEPVYSVTLSDGTKWGDLYASALEDFVL